MKHRRTQSLVFACAATIAMPVAAEVASPHDRAPAHRPEAPATATLPRGMAPTIFQEFIFDFGALDTAAFVTMTASDHDGNGRIEANAGFFEGPVINEILSLTISFWRSGAKIFETTCVESGVIAYPFLYLDWGLGDSGPIAWDLGADPGMFTFGGDAVTPNPGAWFLRTNPLEGGVFGEPIQYMAPEPTILSSERSYAMDAFVVGEVTEEVEPFVFDCVPCTHEASPSDATSDADAWIRKDAFTLFCTGGGACFNEGIVFASITHDSSAITTDEITFEFSAGASRSGDPVNASTAMTEMRVNFSLDDPGLIRVSSVGASDGLSSFEFNVTGPMTSVSDASAGEVLLPAGSFELVARVTAIGQLETMSNATLSGVIAFRQARVRNLTQGVAFTAIQDAIDAAVAGDVIEVLPGVYREQINLLGKAITLRSAIPSNPATVDQTIISGDLDGDGIGDGGRVVRCVSGEGPQTVLDGLTIAHGFSTTETGGALRINASNPTIRRCAFVDNTANRGGAIAVSFSQALIESCRFFGNRSTFGGGAAIWNEGSGPFSTDAPTFVNCVIVGNVSEFSGGAITNIASNPAIINCTLTGNTNVGSAAIANFFNGPLTITNTIVWNNHPSGPPISSGPESPIVSYCIIEGGYAGAGNLDQAPRFIDPSSSNFRLAAGSPAIDAGTNAALPVNVIADIDALPRFLDDPATIDTGAGAAPIVDIGAHEYQSPGAVVPICAADVDGSGAIDFGDLNRVLDAWGADDPTADTNLDGSIDFLDLNRILDAWGVDCQ